MSYLHTYSHHVMPMLGSARSSVARAVVDLVKIQAVSAGRPTTHKCHDGIMEFVEQVVVICDGSTVVLFSTRMSAR